MSEKEYLYSEIFNSIQGEGTYTGQHTLWIRFFLCNLQCNGFGQIDPTNPDTYELPFETYDVSKVKRVEDLPVWDKGCDSSYTWAKKYKHLMGKATPLELVDKVMECNKTEHNPYGLFLHPRSKQRADMCFTGGEPLMKTGQTCSVQMMKHFLEMKNVPRSCTYETNGTQKLSEEFKEFWLSEEHLYMPELFFSVSPKLWTVAGEKRSRAIKPEIVAEYYDLSAAGHLKFVVGSAEREWDEMEEVLELFRAEGVDYPVYIMPVGAREEEQVETAGRVAEIAFKRGYNVACRAHVYLFGNAIGT